MGVLERIPGLLVEVRFSHCLIFAGRIHKVNQTVLLAMTLFNVCKRWTHVGTLPLFRSLLVHGAISYLFLTLTFGLDIVAYTNSKVGIFRPIVPSAPLHMRYSFIIPLWTPSA